MVWEMVLGVVAEASWVNFGGSGGSWGVLGGVLGGFLGGLWASLGRFRGASGSAWSTFAPSRLNYDREKRYLTNFLTFFGAFCVCWRSVPQLEKVRFA